MPDDFDKAEPYDEGITPDRPPRRARRAPDDYDDEDEPDRRRSRRNDQGDEVVATIIPYRNPKALLAYYFGVFTVVPLVGLFLGPTAVVFGIQGIRFANKHPTAKGTGHAVVGIVLGILFFPIALVGSAICIIVPIGMFAGNK